MLLFVIGSTGMRFDIQICPGKFLSLEYLFTYMNSYGAEKHSEESKNMT